MNKLNALQQEESLEGMNDDGFNEEELESDGLLYIPTSESHRTDGG